MSNKMLLLLVVSAMFAGSTSLITGSTTSPQGCCWHSRLSAMLVEVGGKLRANKTEAEFIDDRIEVHYDYTRKQQTYVRHRIDQTTHVRSNVTVIYDYKNGRVYTLPEDGQCYTDSLTDRMNSPCIAQHLIYTHSYTVGSSKNRFQVNSFSGKLGFLTFRVVVTASDCIPVVENWTGDNIRSQTAVSYLFLDIDTNGVNDAMFTPPAICNPGVAATGVGRRDLEALGLERTPLVV